MGAGQHLGHPVGVILSPVGLCATLARPLAPPPADGNGGTPARAPSLRQPARVASDTQHLARSYPGWVPTVSRISVAARAPLERAQWAQQKNRPSTSTPCPMMRQAQCSHTGASRWIAHSNESKVWTRPAVWTSNDIQ